MTNWFYNLMGNLRDLYSQNSFDYAPQKNILDKIHVENEPITIQNSKNNNFGIQNKFPFFYNSKNGCKNNNQSKLKQSNETKIWKKQKKSIPPLSSFENSLRTSGSLRSNRSKKHKHLA